MIPELKFNKEKCILFLAISGKELRIVVNSWAHWWGDSWHFNRYRIRELQKLKSSISTHIFVPLPDCGVKTASCNVVQSLLKPWASHNHGLSRFSQQNRFRVIRSIRPRHLYSLQSFSTWLIKANWYTFVKFPCVRGIRSLVLFAIPSLDRSVYPFTAVIIQGSV